MSTLRCSWAAPSPALRLTRGSAIAMAIAVATLLAGCRRDVEGWWRGHAGGEELSLRIEQTGSDLEGELCSSTACAPIEWGTLEETTVEIDVGCDGCAFPRTSFDLELDSGRLVGEAHRFPCECTGGGDDCDCRTAAVFEPCDGACELGED